MRPLGIRLRPRSRRPNANRATHARPNPSASAHAGAARANHPPITQPNANPAAISRAARPILSDRMRII